MRGRDKKNEADRTQNSAMQSEELPQNAATQCCPRELPFSPCRRPPNSLQHEKTCCSMKKTRCSMKKTRCGIFWPPRASKPKGFGFGFEGRIMTSMEHNGKRFVQKRGRQRPGGLDFKSEAVRKSTEFRVPPPKKARPTTSQNAE